jgi:nucleotide-binding universal stress UspA family protein
MSKTIVICLDGSKLAEQAIPAVSALAEALKADVILASAIVAPDRWSRGEVLQEDNAEEKALASLYLSAIADRLREQDVRTRERVEFGPAAETLIGIADDEGAEFIVMTTHGRSGFTRWILGSVADRVLHLSERPVLLINAELDGHARTAAFKRIIVPLDGSDTAEAALPFVKRLAIDLDASLVLEGVVVPTAALYAGTFIPSSPPALQEIEAGSREYLGAVGGKLAKDGLLVSSRVDTGYAAETILEAGRETGADLIALSTHGRSGPERWIRGSVADSIIRHADRPCLVLPSRQARLRERAKHEEELSELVASVPIAGNTVVPPPTIRETVVSGTEPEARAPEVRPHRSERSPGR